jgi:RNA polymerase sigma factor (sigma-70 family)
MLALVRVPARRILRADLRVSEQTSIHVARAIAGDPDSVAWLITHFQGMVASQVRLRLRGHGTSQDVDDLAADVWVVALQRLADLVPRGERHVPVLVRFLGSTVLGVCNNFLRRRAREVGRIARPDAGSRQPLDLIARQTRGVVSRVLQGDYRSAVDDCLRSLSPDQRDVLVLRLMEHRGNKEIGALLGIPANTVAVRYRRALEALRARLPRPLYEELCRRQALAS